MLPQPMIICIDTQVCHEEKLDDATPSFSILPKRISPWSKCLVHAKLLPTRAFASVSLVSICCSFLRAPKVQVPEFDESNEKERKHDDTSPGKAANASNSKKKEEVDARRAFRQYLPNFSASRSSKKQVEWLIDRWKWHQWTWEYYRCYTSPVTGNLSYLSMNTRGTSSLGYSRRNRISMRPTRSSEPVS